MRPDHPVPRLALVVAAAVAAALGAPTWLSTPLTAAAAVAVVAPLAARRRLGGADALLVGIAAVLGTLTLLGLALNLLPGGLSRTAWALGAGILGVAAIALGTGRRPVTRRATRPAPSRPVPHRRAIAVARQAPWYVGAVALAAVAIAISVRATDAAERAPMSLAATGTVADGRAVVEIRAGTQAGRYELLAGGRRYGPITLPAGATERVRVALTPGVRTVVALRAAGTTTTLRSLVLLDRP